MSLRHRSHFELIALFILLAITRAAVSQAPTPRKIELKKLQEDFQIARTALEQGHSGIYRYTSKIDLDRAFDAAAKKIDHAMEPLEFYRILAPPVAKIKCGHTGVLPPQDILKAREETIPLFPFDVEVLGGKVYVAREYLPEEPKLTGLEIRRINHVGIKRILSTMLAATPGDADSQTVRPWRIAHQDVFSFPRTLYSLLGIEAPFEIDFRDPKSSEKRTLNLSGVTGHDREKIAAVRYPQDKRPASNASLKFLDDGKIAVLTVREFSGKADTKPVGDYFDVAFRQIHDQNSESLIIDVRNNGGGNDDLGKKLLSFLLDQPFKYYDDLIFNAREFDFFRYTDGAQPIPSEMVEKRADGKFHDIKHPNLGIQQPSQPHFGGRVFVLMNGGSFSTTCEFLSNLHDRKRATFVGEEAGGGYFGNTSGRAVLVILPNSKVGVRIPLRTYYLAVKDGDPKRSILPDYQVRSSINDLLSGNDTVMTRAVALAHAQRRQPGSPILSRAD